MNMHTAHCTAQVILISIDGKIFYFQKRVKDSVPDPDGSWFFVDPDKGFKSPDPSIYKLK